jgi:membrane protease YdiL (CAAX protease family)
MSDSPSLPEPADGVGGAARLPAGYADTVMEAEPAELLLAPQKPSPGPAEMVLAVVIFSGVPIAFGVSVGVIAVLWKVLTHGPRAVDNLRGAWQDLLEPVVIVTLIVSFATAVCIPLFSFRDHIWRRLAVRGIDPLHLFLALGMVVPLLVVMVQAAEWSVHLRGVGNPETPKEYEVLADLPWHLAIVMACLLPGLGEEIFFRGFLGRGLVGRYNIFPGLIIASVLFGLGHFDSVQHILATTLLGLCLHAVYLMTKTLTAPVLMHMANNALGIGMMMLDKAPRQGQLDWNEVIAKLISNPIVAITAAATLVGLGFFMYQTRIRWVLPNGEEWSPGYTTAEMPSANLEARPQRRQASWAAAATAVFTGGFFAAAMCWTVFQT